MTGHSFEKKRYPGQVELLRKVNVNLFERTDVVGAIVEWERHAGHQDPDSGLLKGLNHLNLVGAGGRNGQPTQAIVASEFKDYDCGFGRQNVRQTLDSVSCSITAHSHVDDAIPVASGIDQALEIVGITFARFDPEPGGQTIAESYDYWARIGPGIGLRGGVGRDGGVRAGRLIPLITATGA